MGEATRAEAKSSEAKKENVASQKLRTDLSPAIGSPEEQILFLQKTIGNQAVGRLIKSGALKAKLKIGQPGDIYEQKVDRVAEQVMRMLEPQIVSGKKVEDEKADAQRNANDSELQSTAAQIEQNRQQKMDFIGQMEQSDMVQRTPDPAAGVDQNEAMIHAVNMVNKNSMLKIKLPVKAPPGRKVFGGLELKKIELELDVLGEVSAPGVTNAKSTTKVAAGAQNVGQSEADPTKRAANEAQGTIYALEMEQKFGSSPFEEMFSIKPGVEYGSYTAANALTPNKQEFKGKVGFQIAAEGFAIEIQFIPIAYDKTKTGKDAFKLGTFAAKISKEFVHKMPGMINLGGSKVDVALKAKLTGSAEIGPDYAAAYETLGKYLGKEAEEELAKQIAPRIAYEDAELTMKKLVQEIVEDETKDIVDVTARKQAIDYAERKLMVEVEKRQLELVAAQQASIFVSRELSEKAGEKLTIFAIRAEANRIVQTLAKPLATELRGAVAVMIKEGIEQISLRSIVRKTAAELVPGPADFVLIGIQILYNYADTIMKDIDIKELGLRVMACRDNYVAGYTSGLRGEASGGEGGAGTLEGASQMLGLKEGGAKFNAMLALHLQGTTVTKEKATEALMTQMQGMAINKSAIMTSAAPKLQDMMMKSYEKKYSGGAIRWLFGDDLKNSKDYKHFQEYMQQYLQPDKTNTLRARLKRKGVDKEVYVTLVMLDSTSDRAQKFRTEDGRHMVTLSGDTENFSGWVAEDGKPLEDYYMDQNAADQTSSDEAKAKQVEEMKEKLHRTTLVAEGTFNGLSLNVTSAKLSGAPDDLEFQEFMRSPAALSMTVNDAGLLVRVEGTQRLDKEATGWEKTYKVSFKAYGASFGPKVEVTDLDGITAEMEAKNFDKPGSPAWDSQLKGAVRADLANRRLAALPRLV